MADIFLSYSKSDRAHAQAIAQALKQQGWSVWWDHEIPIGRTWDEVIEEEIGKARAVVVLWSSHSVASNWVKNEARDGLSRHILMPVMVETVKLPIEFRHVETADLSTWRADDPHPEFSNLLEGLARLLGEPKPVDPEYHPKAPRKPDNFPDDRFPFIQDKPSVWSAILVMAAGWAIGGAIGLVLIFYWIVVPQALDDAAFPAAMGWGMTSAIGGLSVALALKRLAPAIKGKHIGMFMFGGALGGAIGAAISWSLPSVLFGFIGGAIGGGVFGVMIAFGLESLNSAGRPVSAGMAAFAWAIAGGAGGALSWASADYSYTATYYAFVGLITGATIGSVGGALMLWWWKSPRD